MLQENELVTGEARLSYCNLLEAKAINNVGTPQYSVKILIPKTDTQTIDKLKKAMNRAVQNGVTEGKKPFAAMSPQQLAAMRVNLDDGDTKFPDNPECKGHWCLNAKTPEDKPPGILVDYPEGTREKPRTPTDIYSGMYGMVNIQLYAYNKAGNQGVGVSLQNVLKTRDGDPLGGTRKRAEDVFGMPAGPFENAAPAGGGSPL